ncbi:uncharacterized protein LOC119080860 [Bradysia coprophila]|uniref:uncharacterized protein LOC119080860 n=1 Tax=Bradysia coprophila TaxID=38358 RepID=UPI00187D8165|nr:uncharacterized protein LOC119080860 [Bradysia coprophila]
MNKLIWLFAMMVLVLGDNTFKLNIEQLANISRFYRFAQICEHECDIKTRYEYDGRIIISFKTNIKPKECDDVLCKCMWKYLNQRCWLTDVERKCIVKGGQLTIYLIGPPNPNYDPLEPLPTVTAPIATLGDVLKYYPELEISNHKCNPTTNTTASGLTCMSIECKLRAESPCFETVCENILETMNQCKWLGDFENTCSTRAGKVIFEMTGK